MRELTHRVAEVSEQVRERMNRLGAADLASQDVLIEVAASPRQATTRRSAGRDDFSFEQEVVLHHEAKIE